MKVTILIPCYNEKDHITELLQKVAKVDLLHEKEIIVVDDFSTDGTREMLQTNLKDLYTTLILHDKNMGKGAGLNTGFQQSTGDTLIVQDADLEYEPEDYHALLEPIEKGKANVVYGSRFLDPAIRSKMLFLQYWANRILTIQGRIFTRLKMTDMETCYKVFHKDIYKKITIEENGFAVDPELTVKSAKLNCNFVEVPCKYYPRSFKEGKKITYKDGFKAMWCIVKYTLFK